ncbi:hypothetical protein IFM89_015852 [Coptis chinensis]|uniref:Uncharacterized protein n=1 Tax=Coptis chinensis TaxID=261450 RepID=A0A835INH4_9MAGN|nr:hypothetical protein IFM89_015852 [Coptis chinensis]
MKSLEDLLGLKIHQGGGGPLFIFAWFLIFPLLWSVPEALVTAELATSYPENGGGLNIVGFTAVSLATFSLLPFLVMGLLSIPRIRPKKWLVVDFSKVDWRGYFNSMFWNLNYWDKASTLAGEVQNPSRIFPKALLGAVVLVVLSYLKVVHALMVFTPNSTHTLI